MIHNGNKILLICHAAYTGALDGSMPYNLAMRLPDFKTKGNNNDHLSLVWHELPYFSIQL
jgi:hypothetical protein